MIHFFKMLAMACIGLCLGSCSSISYLGDAVLAPPQMTVSANPELGPLEIYSFDTGPDPESAIFFVSGSGCPSLRYFLKRYFTGLQGSYRIFAVQKAGVGAMATGGSCSSEFNAVYTAENLLARNAAALAQARAGFDGSIAAVVGVSEGGFIAASLAADNPDIGHLVIIGSGGMTFREELELLAESRGQEGELAQGLAEIAANPNSSTDFFLGLPHRYFTSMLDLDPMLYFQRSKQPVLLIAGEKDASVPIASMQMLYERLTASQRNVTFELVSGADHTLRGPQGDAKPEIMAQLARWLAGEPWSHER